MYTSIIKNLNSKISKSVLVAFMLLCSFVNFGQYSGTGTFNEITSLTDLTDGYYVITRNSEVAMNNSNTSNYFQTTSVSGTTGTLTDPSASIVWKIEFSGSEFTIYNEASTRFVGYTGGGNKAHSVTSGTVNSSKWTASLSSTKFVFTNVASSTRILQYNAGAPRFACYTSNQQKFVLFKMATPPTPPTWNGSVDSDWNTAANWTPSGVPAATASVIVPAGMPNEPSITNLTVTGDLTLESGANLTVTGVLTNDGVIAIKSGATLVQTTGSTTAGTGIYEVEQDVTGNGTTNSTTGRFYYMGSPVPATTTLDLGGAAANRVFTYNETANAYTEVTSTTSTPMAPTEGFAVIFDAASTVSFQDFGINNGSITTGSLTNASTGLNPGFNMVSNPYPSYLDWDGAVLNNVNPTIWFQTKDGSGNKVFDMYNSASGIATSNSGSITNEFIAPMQAFWVEVATGPTTLTFDNSMRSHQAAGSGLKFDINNFDALVRMNLTDESSSDEAVIFFHNEANNSVESFDSKKMMTIGANQLYSTVAGQKFAMNGLQAQQNITRSVPLTIETIESKEYTLKASQIHFPQGQVYIEDKARQIMQNLSGNAEYTFDATAGTDADRFVLHFEANNGLSIAEATKENISIAADMVGNVTVKLDENATVDGTITIVDAAGRVISTNAISNSTTKLNVAGVSGLYFVRVSNAGTVATEKIIIAQ